MGEGYVPYEGEELWGTNIVGEGPSGNLNPYKLKNPNNSSKYLEQVDRIDAADAAATANLYWRKDNNFGLNETFGYNDTFKNKLTSWEVGSQLNTAAFMLNGNITNKSDMGN